MNFRASPRIAIFFLFLVTCIFPVNSQEAKLIAGQILSDSIPVSNIHVINLNQKKGATSDLEGEFQIYARVGDSILFSSVQFQNRTIRLKKEEFDSARIEIKLYPARNELDEVRISDLKLSGVLQEDINRIKFFDRTKFGIPYPKEQPTQIERKLYTATSSAGGIPLDPLLNAISGRTKMLKKAKANEELSFSATRTLNKFGKEFFVREFELPEAEVINFLYYCADDEQFKSMINSENELRLIQFLSSKISDFKELRQID